MKTSIPITATALFCLVALTGCKKKTRSGQPHVPTTLRAYSAEARRCTRDSECVVTHAWHSCCAGCLKVPRAWNRRAYDKFAARAAPFCRPARRRCPRASCNSVISDVLQNLDLFPRCLAGRCVVRWREGRPDPGRDYLLWFHPGRNTDGKALENLPPIGTKAKLTLETLRFSAKGDPRLMRLPDTQPLKYSNWSVLADFWPLLEGYRIVLEGRVRTSGPPSASAKAGPGLTLESGAGWRLPFHPARGVTRPRAGSWIRVEGLVVGHADRIQPLRAGAKGSQPAGLFPPLQDPFELLSLIRVHWNPAKPPASPLR